MAPALHSALMSVCPSDGGLLSEAISNIMHNKVERSPQDAVRLFFRQNVIGSYQTMSDRS